MKIFEALRQDHEKQRLLMNILMKTTGSSQSRKSFFVELKTELANHALAEERHFYAPLMEFDDTIETSRHAVAEHHEIDELIAKVEQAEMSSSAWMAHMKNLQHKVLHHLAEEEREFFQQARKVLSAKQNTKLADAYQYEMRVQAS
jgi:hemerythrin superfamily protein